MLRVLRLRVFPRLSCCAEHDTRCVSPSTLVVLNTCTFPCFLRVSPPPPSVPLQEVSDESQLSAVLDMYPVYRSIWAVHQNEAYGDKVRAL